jgi:anti-sigma B factor antagonist
MPMTTRSIAHPTQAEAEPTGIAVVAPEGELDLATAPALCARLARTRADRVLLDLDGIDFCDSAGLRTIVGAAQEAVIHGGRLVVVAPPASPPAKLLALTGLEEFLTVAGDREAGFERLGRGRRASLL